MALFISSGGAVRSKNTTSGFFFGTPEAEGERGFEKNNGVVLFEDYFDVLNSIESGRFIISGRKGTGKSAIVRYVLDSRKDDEVYADVVTPEDYVLYKQAVTAPDGTELTVNLVWQWIVLTKFVKMILDTKVNTTIQEYKSLNLFWDRNSGFLAVDKFDVKEVLLSKGGSVSINSLKKVLSTEYRNLFDAKMDHAPFYKIIPALRDIVTRVLKMQAFRTIDYVLLFDDLDLDFKLNNESDQQLLLELIRVAKEYNTTLLIGSRAKILLLVRDDVSRRMKTISTDSAKIFGSYECPLKWYSHEIGDDDDQQNRLKRFINHRLEINFKKLCIQYNKANPWESFVKDDYTVYDRVSPFRYLLNFTFYRPRDFINMFKDVGGRMYLLPLTPLNIKSLLKEYVIENMNEIMSELLICFSKDEVNNIKKFLKVVSDEVPVEYNRILELMKDFGIQIENFETLINYNLLVPRDEDKHQYFNYREKPVDKDYSEYKYVLPQSIYAYFKSQTILPNVN